MNLEQFIVNIPNFPKPGVTFKDISPLLRDRLPELMTSFERIINPQQFDVVVGIESRGFILGSALAAHLKKGFIPIRKKGKLPPPVIARSYELEYGSDTLEIQPQAKAHKILLIDDVLATGGTLRASLELCQQANMQVTEIAVLINLRFLNKFTQESKIPLRSILNYD
jgi:adenine phosphoribosyltransferase